MTAYFNPFQSAADTTDIERESPWQRLQRMEEYHELMRQRYLQEMRLTWLPKEVKLRLFPTQQKPFQRTFKGHRFTIGRSKK